MSRQRNRSTKLWGTLLVCVLPIHGQPISLIDAIEATLSRHPQLAVQRERIIVARSQVMLASSQFDTQVDAQAQQALTHLPLTGLQQLQVDQAGLGVSNQSSNVTNATGSATKLMRTGVQFSGSANLTRITDNLVQTGGTNLSLLRFQINIPLLRGRGRDVVAAEENAARIDTDAALYDANHTAATLMTDTATRYWEVVAARQSLEVLQQSEERGRTFVTNVRTLIDAEKLPRAELQQVLANLATRTANSAAAEQRLVEATQALALAMGLPVEELLRALDPADALPDGERAPLPSMNENDVASWLQRSLTRRADYLSLRKRQGAFELRRDAAANRIKPQLDFRIATGYSGLQEGRRPDQFVVSPFTNLGGADVIGGLIFNLPVGRHAAKSLFEQTASAGRQNLLNTQDLARSITSSVLAGVGAYKNAIVRVQEARASVDASQAALDGEREKLRLGVGSVVDLLTIEDRLTNARTAYVDAGLNFAILLARLRFATGTLIEPDRVAQSVQREIFYHPPWEDR